MARRKVSTRLPAVSVALRPSLHPRMSCVVGQRRHLDKNRFAEALRQRKLFAHCITIIRASKLVLAGGTASPGTIFHPHTDPHAQASLDASLGTAFAKERGMDSRHRAFSAALTSIAAAASLTVSTPRCFEQTPQTPDADWPEVNPRPSRRPLLPAEGDNAGQRQAAAPGRHVRDGSDVQLPDEPRCDRRDDVPDHA